MSLLQNSNAISAGGYTIDNSLRFRSSASAYLNRTPSVSGSASLWTWSGWVKRGLLGSANFALFSAAASTTAGTSFRFLSSTDTLDIFRYNGTAYNWRLTTTQVFRDPSAWYHIVIAFDSGQATASNRVKIYVNGDQITSFSTATYPITSYAEVNGSGYVHYVGRSFAAAEYFDGYQTEVNWIDGQALTPSSFGETDSTTGVWKPKAYTGTYGTNGFYLKFSDIATTSGSNAGLGKDFANTNYWTTNNISVTAGSTYDAMIDSPTNASVSGTQPVGNYATFSGTNLGTYANATITEAGLKVSVSSGGTPDGGKAYAPFGMSDGSGKWYFEMTCVDPGSVNQRLCFGIVNITTNPNAIAITNGYYASASGAHGNYNIGTFTTNDILQVAYDSGSNKLWFGKNGTWYNSGDPAAGTTPLVTVTSGITYAPFSTYASSGNGPGVGAWNFGQRPFTYTPPSGFKSLCTTNLPDSTIVQGNKYMDATLYTGTGSSLSVTNATSFKPDMVWIKSRSIAQQTTAAYDSVRGADKTLLTYDPQQEVTNNNLYGGLSAFNSNGFSVVTGSDTNTANQRGWTNAATYVAWQWQAGQGSTSSNTNGSITSTVSVNTTAGFSVVTFNSGAAGNKTVGHGLGVKPAMIILKNRDSGLAASNWQVWHQSLPSQTQSYIQLNLTNSVGTDSRFWANTAPTSTVFSFESGYTFLASNNIVGYCFAEIAGFSKFDSYVANGSTDGPFCYTGFRPKFIMWKNISAAAGWVMYDTSRSTYNAANAGLEANLTAIEQTTWGNVDILSNGFKFRSTVNADTNYSTNTYIYAAFAESPFGVNCRAR